MGKTNLDALELSSTLSVTGDITASGGIVTNGTGLSLKVVGQASETYDAGSIDDGNEEVGELTVTGAALGDYALASFSLDVADLAITAAVTAANTVTYQLLNNTGGAIDLSSGTVKVLVLNVA